MLGFNFEIFSGEDGGVKEGKEKNITPKKVPSLYGDYKPEEAKTARDLARTEASKEEVEAEKLLAKLSGGKENTPQKEQKREDIIKTQFSEKAKDLPNKYANVSIENSGTTYIFKYQNLQQDKEEVNNKNIDKVGKDVKEGKINLERFEGKFLVESVDTNTGEKRGTETLTIGFKDLVKANTPVEIKNLLQTAIEGQHGGAGEKDKRSKDLPKQQEEKRVNVASNKETVIQDIEKSVVLKAEKPTILDKKGTLTVSFSNGKTFELTPQVESGQWKVESVSGNKKKKAIITPKPAEALATLALKE